MAESTEIKSGSSSVKTSVNAKGEQTYEAKVYAGTTQGEMDEIATVAVSTMAKLRSGVYAGS